MAGLDHSPLRHFSSANFASSSLLLGYYYFLLFIVYTLVWAHLQVLLDCSYCGFQRTIHLPVLSYRLKLYIHQTLRLKMGKPSNPASNAIIYTTYGVFLSVKFSLYTLYTINQLTMCSVFGCYIAWRLRHQSKVLYAWETAIWFTLKSWC